MDREVSAYLAGGIRPNPLGKGYMDVYRIDGWGWRGTAAMDLADAGIQALDPLAKVGFFDQGTNEIVDLDLYDIERSTFLLVELMDPKYPYIGTIMELVYAKRFRKPTIVFANDYHRNHPWVRYHATRLFNSYERAVMYARDRFGSGQGGRG